MDQVMAVAGQAEMLTLSLRRNELGVTEVFSDTIVEFLALEDTYAWCMVF